MDFETFRQRVGSNIRKARWATGMTQEEVAGRGLSYRYYQEVERGQRNASLKTLFTLAHVLKVPVAWLVDVTPAATARARERFEKYTPRPPKRGRKPKK